MFDDNRNTEKKISQLRSVADKNTAIEEKLEELISLLSENNFDSEVIKNCKTRLNSAFEEKISADSFKDFEAIDDKEGASREQLLDEFSILLASHKFDSKSTTKYLKIERTNKIILMIIGIIMITLGFAMIVMPAPPYFEMFTIFYFSRDNGVTLMDLISLIIVFAGVYVFVRPLYKKSTHGKH